MNSSGELDTIAYYPEASQQAAFEAVQKVTSVSSWSTSTIENRKAMANKGWTWLPAAPSMRCPD
jgi:hypothetical protein